MNVKTKKDVIFERVKEIIEDYLVGEIEDMSDLEDDGSTGLKVCRTSHLRKFEDYVFVEDITDGIGLHYGIKIPEDKFNRDSQVREIVDYIYKEKYA